jgi:hypothetical protein
VNGRLARLFGWGTGVASGVTAVGAVLEWTPWQPVAAALVLAGAAGFAALPVASLVLQAVAHRGRRDARYLTLTAVVLAVVLADALTATLLR